MSDSSVDVAIVGAGFAGMYMLHRMRELGFTARVFEAGSGVGGTWFWNRYPGARCDVESMEYSYSFSEKLQQEWHWSERFAAQPEILNYANHVADRFDLRREMQFNTRVTHAHFDEQAKRWRVGVESVTQAGQRQDWSARFVVLATGCLSSTNKPAFEGLDDFQGATYHTGQWPHEPVDFTGKRVAVIGTGSSAIQSIPVIAAQASKLYVLQRTATYAVPARNAPLDPAYEAKIKADYKNFRARNREMIAAFGSNMPRNDIPASKVPDEVRLRAFEDRYRHGGLTFMGAFNDLLIDPQSNRHAADFVRQKIRSTVKNPEVAEKLIPKQIIGCKRMVIDTNYFETYNLPHVELVDISEKPIERITRTGLRAAGRELEVDCIVFATGFDAMTGSILKIDIRGRRGAPLSEHWSAGPRTYLGLNMNGFPNLFTISGPGSPSVLTNMIISIEQHVDFVADCLAHLRKNGLNTIEARGDAEEAWVRHVNAVADTTLYPTCNSWYVGANVPGKTRVFMPLLGFPPYVKKCEEVVAKGYEGFELAA